MMLRIILYIPIVGEIPRDFEAESPCLVSPVWAGALPRTPWCDACDASRRVRGAALTTLSQEADTGRCHA